MVAYADRFSNIHNKKWTWDELSKLDDPPSAEHAIIDPRFHALWESMRAEVQGFYDSPVVKIHSLHERDKDKPIVPMITIFKSRPQGVNWTK